MLNVRIAAAVLGAAAFMPWYSSQALVDSNTYLGNPLPLIDWVVIALAVLTIARPSLGRALGVLGALDVVIAGWFAYVDYAEGLRVAIGPGLPVAFAASVTLLLFRPKAEQPRDAG